MRLLAIAFLLLSPNVFQQQNPSSPTEKPSIEERDAEKKTDSNQHPASDKTLPNIPSGALNKAEPTATAEPRKSYDASNDTLYRIYLAATIVGVAGGFLGVGILIWQTVLTRRSANAARDAANAAKTSSEAIINSERPWLFIKITTSDTETDENGIVKHLGFSVSFQNYGKTPAEVVFFDQHPDCIKDPDDMRFTPKYRLEGNVMVNTRMIPPGETWRDPGWSYFSPESFLLEDQWKDIRGSRQRLVYWGRLQYRDLIEQSKTIHELKSLGTIHETCFCYFWSPALNEFLVCGPWGYNKHT